MTREPSSYGEVVDGTSQQFIFQTKWNGKRPEKKALFLDKKHVKMATFLLQLNNNIRKENGAVLIPLLCYFGLGEIITVIYICQSSAFLFYATTLLTQDQVVLPDHLLPCCCLSMHFFLLKYSSLYLST